MKRKLYTIVFVFLLLFLTFSTKITQAAEAIKQGSAVEFVTKDGVKHYGTVQSVSKDFYMVTPSGKSVFGLGSDFVSCVDTGEVKSIRPSGSYTNSNYRICNVTLKDGSVIKGGFTSNLVIWINETNGKIHRLPVSSYSAIKCIPHLPGKIDEKDKVQNMIPAVPNADTGTNSPEDIVSSNKEHRIVSFSQGELRPKNNKGTFAKNFSYTVPGPGKLNISCTYHLAKSSRNQYGACHFYSSLNWDSPNDAVCKKGGFKMPKMFISRNGKYEDAGKVSWSETVVIMQAGTIRFRVAPESVTAYFNERQAKWLDDSWWSRATHYMCLGGKSEISLKFTPSKIKNNREDQEKSVVLREEKKTDKSEERILTGKTLSENIIGDGMSKFTIEVFVRDVNGKPVNNAVISVKSPDNIIEAQGPYATGRNGMVRIRCRVRHLVKQDKPIYHKLSLIHSYGYGSKTRKANADVLITLTSCPRFVFRMLNLDNQPVPNEELQAKFIKYPNGFVDSIIPLNTIFRIRTNKKGEAYIWAPAGTEATVSYRSALYAQKPFRRKNFLVCPATELLLHANANTAPEDIRNHYIKFLKKAGIPDEAMDGLRDLKLKRGNGWKIVINDLTHNPQYMSIVEPNFLMRDIFECQRNMAHECGHWFSNYLDKKKSAGESHESIWKPCSDKVNAFEEAEAHFFAHQYLRKFRYSYDSDLIPESPIPKDIERGKEGSYEGVVAKFLIDYYQHKGSTYDSTPEEIIRDFQKTMERAEKPIRTIDDFIKEKKRQVDGLHIPDSELPKLVSKYRLH